MYPHSFLYKNSLKSISLLILLALGLAAIFAPRSTGVSVQWPNASPPEDLDTKREAFGRLPLSFELNQGQTDARVRFLARGQGYGIFLTDNGAAFSFGGTSTTLHMRLQDAATSPRITGVDQLPGKTNYLLGNKSDDWRTGIPTYERVRYEQIYPGVDLVYYGNQRQLEYDFVVQPGASFKQIRMAFDGAGKLKLNRRGDLILQSGSRKITLLRPVAYQEISNKRRAVSVRYLLKKPGQVAFQVGDYDKTHPLVIDPVLVYSTYLGGFGNDQGNSIAVDASGNAYIAGQTAALNFPTSSPLQAANGGGTDAFVAKLNASGSALLYSTFLGGSSTDIARGIAVDNAGNAYITGQTNSTNFPVLNALHSAATGFNDAFVAELNSSGSALVYSTYLGGRLADVGNSIAVDSGANAYITGTTLSPDFPTANPLQANRSGNPLFKSTDSAGNWAASDSGLFASNVTDIDFQPGNSAIIYAVTDAGLFKTTDDGTNWTPLPTTPQLAINRIAIDPTNPAIIYAAATGGMFKSTGGSNFTEINNGFSTNGRTIVIDPVTPTTLYATSFDNTVRKSVNAGANWTTSFIEDANVVNGVTVDPNTPTTLYAATNRGVFKSTNSGSSWAPSNFGVPFTVSVNSIAIDTTNSAVYAATTAGVFKSVNGGTSWTNIHGNFSLVVSSIAIDPTNSSVLYITTFFGPQKSVDGGATWTTANTGYPNTPINVLVINPTAPSTLLIGTSSGSDVFVTKLAAGGTSKIYSTFLGGNMSDSGNSIALDASGNAYLTGSTVSINFPTANAFQAVKGDSQGGTDAFVTKLNANGSALVYSSFLGAEINDVGRSIAVDTSGNAYVGGTTSSQFFPVANAFQPMSGSFANDAFIAKVNAAGSALVYSTYLGGDFNDECLAIAVDAAGSAYVTGTTTSSNFPTLAPLQAQRNGLSSEVFITKFAPSGSSLIYSTYFGGTGNDSGLGISVDSSLNVYITGFTGSENFPTATPLQPGIGGSADVFVAKLRPAPDVQVTLIDAPDPVDFGSDLNYAIEVRNIGEVPATGVTVTDTLPAGSTFVTLSNSIGTCTGTTTITCNLGTMNPGDLATISIQLKPPAVSPLSNTVNATLNETDAFTANNTATSQTVVRFTDVSLTKSAAQNLVAPGGKLTYSLTVKNNGPLSTLATVTDPLPAGTSLIRCVTTTATVCGQNGNSVSAAFASLEAGTSATMLLTVGVDASATPGTVINNTASVFSTTPDSNTSNNSSSASATVAAVAVLPKSNGLIAFATDRNFSGSTQPSGIYSIKPDGTDEKVFPNTPTDAVKPAWSPDGTKLAFQFRRFTISSFVNEISVMNPDGTGRLTVATNVSDFNRTITWSPNGSQIAYIGTGGPLLEDIRTVHIANVDGSGSYRLPGSASFLSSVDWSPDGSKFVYSNEREIFVMNADATGQTKLTQPPDGSTDLDPRWSPDGTKILVLRFTSTTGTVHVMNADGSNFRRLFDFNAPTAAWSGDGLSLVVQFGAEICTVNLDNTNFKCLTSNNFFDTQPNWQWLPNPNPTPTPTPVPTFSVSGRVTNPDGSPLLVQVKLSGPVNTFPSMDSNGNFEFVNLPAGQYTLAPLSIFHSFEPATRSITITNANITGQDFVGIFMPANITGHVKDNNGNPLPGIKITSVGGFPEGSTFTDANGFYSFPNVARNRTYSIFPDPFTAYDFAPAQKLIQNLTASEVVDFVGAKQPANVIAGRVIETISGQGRPGVRVDLAQDVSAAAFTFTDANGNFSFGERKSNHSFTVSISDGGFFIYGPKTNPPLPFAQIQIPLLTSDQNLTFTAERANTVQFSAASYSVNEGNGFLEIPITRTGSVASAAIVVFVTTDTAGLTACTVVNGKASERCDYATTIGTLRFNANETSESVFIPIINDANVEGNETFTITLLPAVGAQLGSATNVPVTIVDNDTTPATQNPIDGVDPFVTQQYIDFLGRLPDSVGFANWVATLSGCPNGGFGENDNPSCDRVHVSAGFFLSDEFRGRGYWAYRFYEVGFDRRPLYAEFVPDMAQVGGAQSPESEVLSKAAYTDAFVLRPEFTTRYNALSNSAYVNALEQNAEITLSNKAALIAALDGNQKTRGQVLREIVESKAAEDAFFIRAFVAMQYFGYLRRDPDTIGYNNWVTTLTTDPSNFRHMIFGFLFSTEYRGRFGP